MLALISGFFYFRKKRNREDVQASHDGETFAEADGHEKIELDVLSATAQALESPPRSIRPDSRIMDLPVSEPPQTGPIHSNTSQTSPVVNETEAILRPSRPVGKRRADSV